MFTTIVFSSLVWGWNEVENLYWKQSSFHRYCKRWHKNIESWSKMVIIGSLKWLQIHIENKSIACRASINLLQRTKKSILESIQTKTILSCFLELWANCLWNPWRWMSIIWREHTKYLLEGLVLLQSEHFQM